ncbi:TonB-dependent receptor [Flavobacterium amniphilum]|uniref:TonB-dependent receptor n=1 Tax=Flavobacterium amniphilum TaxID=1834035 RepID=UPI00202A118D|nr:TonB-dependent receptor [Flavobacterium amniphilum]MCL9805816.1 TonB-dependent receptor [Flavobacterium amniphilum]MCL9806403.1 TonB-dependent receptor [Flavobacterium amniphilum]
MKSFIISLFIGFSLFVQAQTSISGIVSDENKNVLEGVTVHIPELHIEAKTNEQGKYQIKNLPSGSFTIIFSHPKFDNNTSTIQLNETEIIYDMVLTEEHTHHIDEVVVSTVFNKMQSQNVMKVENQKIKQLKQKGAATLIEGLATIPGVANISTGTSIGKPVIRGLSGNRVLVYTQGVRLENQQFGEEHGLGLNDSGIESVEVIKGPASLLYGSDALGGVLFFNPEKFANPNSYSADFSQKFFSNTLGSSTNFGLKTSSEKWKFLARGGYNTHVDYQMPNSNRVTNSRFEETDFKTGISYNGTKFTSTFRYNINLLSLGLPEEIGQNTTIRNPDFPRQGVLSQIASLHNKIFFKNSKLNLDFGYIANDRKEFEDSLKPILEMDLKTFNFDAKYEFPKMGKFETIVGLQGMNQTNVNSGEEILIPDARINDLGVLATTNYSWKKNVFQAGFRFDNRWIETETHGISGEEGYFEAIDKKFNSFNASLGCKTSITDNLTVRLNVASGFRAPNLAELTSNGVHEGSNRYEIGNPNLKNEQNIQTDLNFEYGNKHFEFFVNGFYNKINNYIFIAPNGNVIDGNDVYDYVQADANLYGGEAGIHLHPHPIDWLHITSSFESVTGKKNNGDYLPLIPSNKWSNTFKTDFELKWLKSGYASLNLDTFLSQNKVGLFETKTGEYSLLNFGLGGNINLAKFKCELSFSANNILNREYVSHLSRLKADGIPNIGRNLIVGLNFNL